MLCLKEIQQEKLVGIRAAIEYLISIGVKKNISQKLISKTTRDLFPEDKNKQVSEVTLSKEFYKENVFKFIRELNKDNLESKNLEKARVEKEKIFNKKMLQITKFLNKYAIELRETSNISKVPNKSQIASVIKNNFGYTINLSIEKYKWLYDEIFLEAFFEKDSNLDSEKNKYKAKENNEIKRLRKEYENLINDKFLNFNIDGNIEEKFIFGDGMLQLHTTTINIKELIQFINGDFKMLFKGQENLTAYQLIELIMNTCKVK